MPLWTYTKKPNWIPNVPDTVVKSRNDGWVRKDTGEILVAIDRFNDKHDTAENNLEAEGGEDFILEDDSSGEQFILLE